MAMSTRPDAGGPDGLGPLPCGRTLTEVWDAWDEDRAVRDPHHRCCPHCSSALDGLRMLEDLVRTAEGADDGPFGPGSGGYDTAGADVATRVMDTVRRELRPGRSLPLGELAEDVWIAEAAAAKTLRAAAETLPDVHAGSCRVLPLDTADTRPPQLGAGGGKLPRGPLRVRLEVAADLSRGASEIAEAVRRQVLAAAEKALGMDVRVVDVDVVDLLEPGHGAGGTRQPAGGGGHGGPG